MGKLSEKEISENLLEIKGWTISDGKLTKKFKFQNFKEALGFIVKVGIEAEINGHHPELFNVYNEVSIQLATHDAGGSITEKDFILAKAIDGAQ